MEAVAKHAKLWSQSLSVCRPPRILHHQHTTATGEGGYTVSSVSSTYVASSEEMAVAAVVHCQLLQNEKEAFL